MKTKLIRMAALSVALHCSSAVWANGIGENTAWQFQSTAEQANKAYIEDMRMKRITGFYSSPQYNTYINTQFNCNQNTSASGNGGTNSATANTPTASAPSSTASGNLSNSTVDPGSGYYAGALNGLQDNAGPVFSEVWGSSSATSDFNDTYQALNTLQDNTGTQISTITDSSACSVLPAPVNNSQP